MKPEDPRVKTIVDDWVTQISELFPGPFFHIGFDETWLLEKEARRLNRTPEELYLGMLRQTTDIVEKQGKQALVWADMLQKYSTIIPRISPKIIAVPWHYFPLSEKEYQQALDPFARQGIQMIVQGASINWSWVVPAYDISFRNTDSLINAGRKFNNTGYITSGWTDDTQTLMRLTFPDMAYGAIASWQSNPVYHDNFFGQYSHAQYPPELAKQVEMALKALLEAVILIRKAVEPAGSTDEAFWANPFLPENLKMAENNKNDLHNGRLRAEDAQVYIRSAMKSGIDTVSLFAMLTSAKMLDYIALKYIYANEIAGFWKTINESPNKTEALRSVYMEMTFKYHTRTSDMLDAIIEMKELFRKAWLDEYTNFRLGVAMGKYDDEFSFWLRFQRKLEAVHRNYSEGNVLPALETIIN